MCREKYFGTFLPNVVALKSVKKLSALKLLCFGIENVDEIDSCLIFPGEDEKLTVN